MKLCHRHSHNSITEIFKTLLQIGWDATERWQQDNEASPTRIFAKTVSFETSMSLNDE